MGLVKSWKLTFSLKYLLFLGRYKYFASSKIEPHSYHSYIDLFSPQFEMQLNQFEILFIRPTGPD